MSSLVVNTNLSALSAFNSLNSTDMGETKAIQELSSGLAVQTAADGPAAYVTSQALTSQANGYETAISNAQDGVSLIQTASGALNQISSILQTMNQLAISSANGATNDATSLAANQQEFAALTAEINQIAATTSYGTTNLLDGTFSGQVFQVGAFDLSNQQISLGISSASASSLGIGGGGGTSGIWTSNDEGNQPMFGGTGTFTINVDGTGSQTVNLTTVNGTPRTDGVSVLQDAIDSAIGAGKVTVSRDATTQDLIITSDSTGSSSSVTLGGINSSNQAQVDIGLWGGGTSTPGTGGAAASVDTASNAEAAISVVQSAISTVDAIEASVGATQNELQSVAANLTVGQQNLSAANSQLVDVNMAQEMTVFSTDQILMQTGTAMLSQAQQAPNLVLKLI